MLAFVIVDINLMHITKPFLNRGLLTLKAKGESEANDICPPISI